MRGILLQVLAIVVLLLMAVFHALRKAFGSRLPACRSIRKRGSCR